MCLLPFSTRKTVRVPVECLGNVAGEISGCSALEYIASEQPNLTPEEVVISRISCQIVLPCMIVDVFTDRYE